MNNKYCLVDDEDGHWYCIPVEERDRFNAWVYEEDDRFDFDSYRIDMHPSNYCFENFEEIHKSNIKG